MQNTPFNAFAGLDVGRKSITLCIVDAHGEILHKSQDFPTSASGLRRLLSTLCKHRNIAIAFEPTGDASLSLLKALSSEAFACFELNGRIIRQRTTSMTQTKTDAADARAIATVLRDLALTASAELERWRCEYDESFSELRLLATEYNARADDVRRLKVQCDKLEHSPVHRAKDLLQRRREELAVAAAAKKRAASEIDAALRQLMPEAAELLTSIPGVGNRVAAFVLAAIGRKRRFANANAFKGFLGVYPRRRQSGGYEGPSRMARHGSVRVKPMIFNAARSAIRYNPVIRDYYERKVEAGMKRCVALGAAMRKLVQIIYGVLASGKPFRGNTP